MAKCGRGIVPISPARAGVISFWFSCLFSLLIRFRVHRSGFPPSPRLWRDKQGSKVQRLTSNPAMANGGQVLTKGISPAFQIQGGVSRFRKIITHFTQKCPMSRPDPAISFYTLAPKITCLAINLILTYHGFFSISLCFLLNKGNSFQPPLLLWEGLGGGSLNIPFFERREVLRWIIMR